MSEEKKVLDLRGLTKGVTIANVHERFENLFRLGELFGIRPIVALRAMKPLNRPHVEMLPLFVDWYKEWATKNGVEVLTGD